MTRNENKNRPVNPNNPAIAELGLNPDYYDATGFPIARRDPESGAVVAGDPRVFGMVDDGIIQIVGTPATMMSGKPPTLREMTLDDIADDCPVCMHNRERILAGDPPMAYIYE